MLARSIVTAQSAQVTQLRTLLAALPRGVVGSVAGASVERVDIRHRARAGMSYSIETGSLEDRRVRLSR